MSTFSFELHVLGHPIEESQSYRWITGLHGPYDAFNLMPLGGGPMFFRVELREVEGPVYPGWAQRAVELIGPNGDMVGGYGPRPLSFYTAEPTDMPTGVVRFPMGGYHDPERQRWVESLDVMALLTVRRIK